MKTTISEKWTYARAVAELPPETRCEIIDNAIFMPPAPSSSHQETVGELYYLLKKLLALPRPEADRGKVFVAPIDVFLDANNTVQPDVVFLSQKKLSLITSRGIAGVPDLVVEIISPSSHYRDTVTKRNLYERFGVAEYWIVDPAHRVIEVVRLQEGNYELHAFAAETGVVTSVVLPGLEVDVAMLFSEA